MTYQPPSLLGGQLYCVGSAHLGTYLKFCSELSSKRSCNGQYVGQKILKKDKKIQERTKRSIKGQKDPKKEGKINDRKEREKILYWTIWKKSYLLCIYLCNCHLHM